jgi:Rod binding domain-containing protein
MTSAAAPIATASPELREAVARPEKGPGDELLDQAREFEGIFVRELLKTAHIGGEQEHGYGTMVVDALARAVTRGPGLGLASRIEDMLSHSQRKFQVVENEDVYEGL